MINIGFFLFIKSYTVIFIKTEVDNLQFINNTDQICSISE